MLYQFEKEYTTDPRGKPISLVKLVIMTHLKLPNATADRVYAITKSISGMQEMIIKFKNGSLTRVQLGLFLRSVGQDWEFLVLLCASISMQRSFSHPVGCETKVNLKKSRHDLDVMADEFISPFVAFIQHVKDVGLGNVYEWKAVLSGKDAQELFGIPKGPSVRVFLEQVIEWQCGYVGEREHQKQECISHFKRHRVE